MVSAKLNVANSATTQLCCNAKIAISKYTYMTFPASYGEVCARATDNVPEEFCRDPQTHSGAKGNIAISHHLLTLCCYIS